MHRGASQRIQSDERSGVLRPANLERFSASWITPDTAVSEIVDTYWTVAWDLRGSAPITQRIIDFPACTLSIEAGDVEAPLMLSTVHPGAWLREISGRGAVFAIRLRPAGLACLTDLHPVNLAQEQEVTPQLDSRTHTVLAQIASATTIEAMAEAADSVIISMLDARPPTQQQLLANRAIDGLVSSPRIREMAKVAGELGVSQRTLQRCLRATLGMTPFEVARRIRLQEVVRRLSVPGATISTIATDLGYADQAHLTNEFRAVTSLTPGRYMRDATS